MLLLKVLTLLTTFDTCFKIVKIFNWSITFTRIAFYLFAFHPNTIIPPYVFRYIPPMGYIKLLKLFYLQFFKYVFISQFMNKNFHTIQLVLFVVQFVFLNTSFPYLNVPVLLFL